MTPPALSRQHPRQRYVATDGTVFFDRARYRRHEMETQCTFRGEVGSSSLARLPGSSTGGRPFNVIDCRDCRILLLDHTDQVQIDNATGCRIFVGASSGSVVLRNCADCTLTVACRQFRARDCRDCTVYLFCSTGPAIERSRGLRFGGFNGAYPGHEEAMDSAQLDLRVNKWHLVHDFSEGGEEESCPPGGEAAAAARGRGRNWSYVLREEADPLWSPLGPGEEPCVPRFAPSRRMPGQFATNSGGREAGHEAREVMFAARELRSRDTTMIRTKMGQWGEQIAVFCGRAWDSVSRIARTVTLYCLGLFVAGTRRAAEAVLTRRQEH